MRPAPVFLVVAVLVSGLGACGGASRDMRLSSQSTPGLGDSANTTVAGPSKTSTSGYLRSDGDNETDDGSRGNDDSAFLDTFGKEARPPDRRAIAELVKRYYVAAAAGDGAKACALLTPSVASGLAPAQVSSGQASADTCAAIVSRLFASQHQRLQADDVATMVVVDAHVKGNLGVAVFGFKTEPLSEILVKREAGPWRLDGLFDSVMP
jgi:hypothetical protein